MKAIGSEIRHIARTNICLTGNGGVVTSGLAVLAFANGFLNMVKLLFKTRIPSR